MFLNQKKLFLNYEDSLSLYEAGVLFTKEELSGYWKIPESGRLDLITLITKEPMMKAIFPDDEITDWSCDNCKSRIEHKDFVASINKDTEIGKISCECSNWITNSSKKALCNVEEFTWDGFIIELTKCIPAPDLRILWEKIPSVITNMVGRTYLFDIEENNHTGISCRYYNSVDCDAWMEFYGNIEDPKTPAKILYLAHTHNVTQGSANEDKVLNERTLNDKTIS